MTICRVLFCIKLWGNYHLQGRVLLVFCIKLLEKYHLQGLVLLVFYIKLLGNYHLQILVLLVFCIKLVGELPFAGSGFASEYWGITISKLLSCVVVFWCR